MTSYVKEIFSSKKIAEPEIFWAPKSLFQHQLKVNKQSHVIDAKFFKKCFFNELLGRIDFLGVLAEQKVEIDGILGMKAHLYLKQDALTLCLCHIDGLSNEYYGKGRSGGSKKNFIDALANFGGDEIFGAVHPRMLIQYLKEKKGKKWKDLFELAKPFLEKLLDEKQIFLESDLIKLIESNLEISEERKNLLRKNLSYGSYAAIAYEELRCAAIHNLGANSISFGEVTFNGEPVNKLSFDVLFKALKSIADKVFLSSLND